MKISKSFKGFFLGHPRFRSAKLCPPPPPKKKNPRNKQFAQLRYCYSMFAAGTGTSCPKPTYTQEIPISCSAEKLDLAMQLSRIVENF